MSYPVGSIVRDIQKEPTYVGLLSHKIAFGEVPTWHPHRLVGFSTKISTHFDDLTAGTSAISYPTSNKYPVIASDDSSDVSGGTGIQSVHVHGLTSAYEEIAETVILNGTTAVTLTNKLLRINSLHSKDVGSSGHARGAITLLSSDSGNQVGCITSGTNEMFQAHFTIPANNIGYIMSWQASGAGLKPLRLMLKATVEISEERNWTSAVFHTQDMMVVESGGLHTIFQQPLYLPTKTDVKIVADVIGTGSATVAGSFELIHGKTLKTRSEDQRAKIQFP